MAYFFEGKLLLAYVLIYAGISALLGIRRKKEERLIYAVFSMLFGIYLYFLIRITQFPIYQTPGMEEALGGNLWISITLIPLKDALALASVYNVILTIPVGLFVPLLRGRRMTTGGRILMFLLPGLFIELAQLVQLLAIGYSLRVVDVNDVIFNSIGVIIGDCLFQFARRTAFRLRSGAGKESGERSLAAYLMRR